MSDSEETEGPEVLLSAWEVQDQEEDNVGTSAAPFSRGVPVFVGGIIQMPKRHEKDSTFGSTVYSGE